MKNKSLPLLVNNENPLPQSYRPCLENVERGYKLDKMAARCARKMLKCARSKGIPIEIVSAYRSSEYQRMLIEKDIQEYIDKGFTKQQATLKTLSVLTLPGRSEHNAALALDLLDTKDGGLEEYFDKTKTYDWLYKNAHNFGYILRYPKGSDDITGISYEPWHYRYVGTKNAKCIKELGITLEEYLQNQKRW